MIDFSKYPRVKRFLEETGMSLHEAYLWIENECGRRGLL